MICIIPIKNLISKTGKLNSISLYYAKLYNNIMNINLMINIICTYKRFDINNCEAKLNSILSK